MNHSPPGASLCGILQARLLKWIAIYFSRGSPDPGIEPRSPASPTLADWFLTTSINWEAQEQRLELSKSPLPLPPMPSNGIFWPLASPWVIVCVFTQMCCYQMLGAMMAWSSLPPSILSPPGGEEEEQWNETICSGEWEMWAENHRWGILANTMDQSSVVGIDPTHLASLSSRLKPHTLHLLITTWDQKKVRDYSLFYKGCASETRSQTSTPPPSSGFPWCLILGP